MVQLSARRFGAAIVAVAAAALFVVAPASALSFPSPFSQPVLMLDDCEPESFNAAVGPGTCVGNGTVTFGAFIATLAQRGMHPAWVFRPPVTVAIAGGTLVAINVGGEAHTFTPVARYGGGFIPELNELSRTPVPAPECAVTLPNGQLIPAPQALATLAGPGERVTVPVGGPGINRFMCCLHPWMKTTALTLGSGLR